MIPDVLASAPELAERVGAHYRRLTLRQWYRMLGSVNLLGNPIMLLDSLGSGVRTRHVTAM